MPTESAEEKVLNDTELAIRQIDSISILPCVAARVVSQLMQAKPLVSQFSQIVESDPGLTAKVLSLLYEHGTSLGASKLSIVRALEKLGVGVLREAFLSVEVFGLSNHGSRSNRLGLIRHSLAVGCCAKTIAESSSVHVDPQMAYLAGLLHDIGKLALEQIMPKSFERISEQAKSQSCSSCLLEQKHLGVDHTILGKRLAQKWHLPEPVGLAIWLHHSDTAAIAAKMPAAKIAHLVQLADLMARDCRIGHSGSYETTDAAQALGKSLGLGAEHLEQIGRRLHEAVEEKSVILGLDSPNGVSLYCRTLQAAAADFAGAADKLSGEHRSLQTASSHLDFVKDFLLSIHGDSTPIDIAQDFAVRWQKFYQTGMVCVYLCPRVGLNALEAVVVETLADAKTVYLEAPSQAPALPERAANGFCILNAGADMDWLFSQLDVDFDLSLTKVMPLRSGPKAVGAIAFELRYPGDVELFSENFEMVTSIAATVLDMAGNCSRLDRFAEQFSQMLGTQSQPPKVGETTPLQEKAQTVSDSPKAALAETAAGLAHELNDPLSKVFARAQQLAKEESDVTKKQTLEQIAGNAGRASAIVKDLMTYAEPPAPRPQLTNIKQILDEAVELSSRKVYAEQIKVQSELADDVREVHVDSGQIVSAVANIICNALESYPDLAGPVKITADNSGERSVLLQITDLGCGMDGETLAKATQPFFSAKTAGRKRGMGLAHAKRLIELNGGSLTIESQLSLGTTVTIMLPGE
jgi:putative nucleotidyltransferase with HDIG domain